MLVVVAVVAVGVGAEVTGHSQVRLVQGWRANADRLIIRLLLLDENLARIRAHQI